MSARQDRSDTYKTDFAGAVRRISGHPGTVFDNTDYAEFALGSVCFDTSRNRFYINVDGTTGGWKTFSLN